MERDRPAGVSGRRRRLSDAETAARMLQAATAMVSRSGLTVSLEHLSFEDVIREAGVARSAAYRRWPYKDLFFGDLLKELARAVELAEVAGRESQALVARVAAEHLDWLETPATRRRLLAELLRLGAAHDFELLAASPAWRSYLALHATVQSLPDGELRAEVSAALSESERGFIRRVAASWGRVAGLLGYRVRADAGVSLDTVAALASASLRGLTLLAAATPDLATQPVTADPLGTGPAEWTPAALGVAGVAATAFEADPTVTWDDARLAVVREALTSL